MPQLGLGLRANVSGISFYDGDAAAYFSRAGVTDATAKAQINAFVKGVKDLGLWSSMVCWPLRSTQNAGTGSTVYSLGGYGTYDGTKSGTISWGTNGMLYANDSSFKYITTGFTMAYDAANSLFAVGALTATSSLNRRYFGFSGQASTPLSAGVDANSTLLQNINVYNGVYSEIVFSGNTDISTFNWFGISTNYATGTNNLNAQFNSTFGTTSRASSGAGKNLLHIGGGQSVSDTFTGTISFASYFPTSDVSQANKLLLYSLYKTTLGTGLGLP